MKMKSVCIINHFRDITHIEEKNLFKKNDEKILVRKINIKMMKIEKYLKIIAFFFHLWHFAIFRHIFLIFRDIISVIFAFFTLQRRVRDLTA